MNYKIYISTRMLFILVGGILASCLSYEDPLPQNNDEYFVTLEEAVTVSENWLKPGYEINTSSSGRLKGDNKNKKAKKVKKVPDEDGNTVFYIVNFEESGFMIVSADKRREPILAYSEDNPFDDEADYYPAGLVEWLSATGNDIKSIRQENKEQQKWVKELWKTYKKEYYQLNKKIESGDTGAREAPDPDEPIDPDDPYANTDPNCENSDVTVGPLITTLWDQDDPYNSQAPMLGGSCRALSGCVAAAIAQVMRYHEYPASFDWGNMPNSISRYSSQNKIDAVAGLLRSVGNSVDMDWGCSSSSAETKDGEGALESTYGYLSASFGDYSAYKIKQNINFEQPVILRGYRSRTNWGLFYTYDNGHAWVCDGYRNIHLCSPSQDYLTLHMNWGWGGSYNAWYASKGWNIDMVNGSDRNYQYKNEMLYNIIPN